MAGHNKTNGLLWPTSHQLLESPRFLHSIFRGNETKQMTRTSLVLVDHRFFSFSDYITELLYDSLQWLLVDFWSKILNWRLEVFLPVILIRWWLDRNPYYNGATVVYIARVQGFYRNFQVFFLSKWSSRKCWKFLGEIILSPTSPNK